MNASGRLPLDRTATRVGPISIEVIEALRLLRVQVDPAADLGLSADVTFRARSVAFAEPHFSLRAGTSVIFDYTRMTQLGAWAGTLAVDGTTITLDPAVHRGARDRSWGVRPVGEQPEPGVPFTELPQFFWLWAPLDWGDECTHFSVNEYADGRRWHQCGAVVPLLDPGADHAFDPGGLVEPMRDVDFSIDWQPGTRRSRAASITFTPWHGDERQVALDPLVTFPMRGLGYFDPDWGHGRWKDELAFTSRKWEVAALDPTDLANVHVQQLCRATDGHRAGLGVLEQLILNEHESTGLRGFVDGHRAGEAAR